MLCSSAAHPALPPLCLASWTLEKSGGKGQRAEGHQYVNERTAQGVAAKLGPSGTGDGSDIHHVEAHTRSKTPFFWGGAIEEMGGRGGTGHVRMHDSESKSSCHAGRRSMD